MPTSSVDNPPPGVQVIVLKPGDCIQVRFENVDGTLTEAHMGFMWDGIGVGFGNNFKRYKRSPLDRPIKLP